MGFSVDSCDPQSIPNSPRGFFPRRLLFVCASLFNMKCFVSVLGLIGAAAAAPQFLADTPEVQEAKIAFARAFNKAAKGSAIALQQAGVQDPDPNDPDYSPPAVPYVHVDIPAEPYVHNEPAFDDYENDEPVQQAAAAVPAAPVRQAPAAAPAFPAAPVQAQAPAVQNPFPVQNPQYNGIFSPQQLAFNPQQQRFAFNPQQQQQFAFNPQQQQQFAFNPQQQQFAFPQQQQQFAFPQQQQQFAFNPQQQQQFAFPQATAIPEQARA